MHYKVIFDLTQNGFHHWEIVVAAVLFIALTIGLFWHKNGGRYMAGALSLFLVLMNFFVLRDYFNLLSAMRHSQCDVVEGTITQFGRPTTSTGKSPQRSGESFVVNGKQFRYFERGLQNGFHQLGIIREGMQVHIYYFNNDIARLEIAP
jgi:hypothetical protein